MAETFEKVSSAKIVNNGGKCLGRRCGRQTDDRLFLIHALRGSESNSDGRRTYTTSFSGIKEIIRDAAMCDTCMEKRIAHIYKNLKEYRGMMLGIAVFSILLGAGMMFIILWAGIAFAVVGVGLFAVAVRMAVEFKHMKVELETLSKTELYARYKIGAIKDVLVLGGEGSTTDVFLQPSDVRGMTVENIRKKYHLNDSTAIQVWNIVNKGI